MSLLEHGYAFLAKPRVVHSIPGRLRLHVPLLKKYGKQHESWAELLCQLLCVPHGIEEVSPSLVTGTVLVRYDAKRHGERDVITFITGIIKILLAHRELFVDLGEAKPEYVLERLKAWLGAELQNSLHLDTRKRIEADVFH